MGTEEEANKEVLEAIKKLTEQTDAARADSLDKRIKQLEAEELIYKEMAEQGKTIVGRAAEALDLEETKLELRKLNLKLGKAENDDTKEKIADEERLLGIKRQGYNDAEGFAKKFMGITREPTSELGKFLVGGGARLEGLVSGLSEVVDGMSIMTSTVDKVVETTIALAFEQDQSVVAFRRATGASGEFDANIRGLERSLFTAGVSSAEAGQAVQSLFLNVTDFTEMSETHRETLGETVAVLNELGVASETTAKNMQFAMKVMGKSTDQAAELQRELFTFAQELGVSSDKMASDFASMGPQIAALGSNGVDAFKKLEVQAKNTGLQLSEILGIVEKFDKFDSAAQSVGKLNALLGGPYLNTLELVAETDPSKRFEILKDRIDDAGLSFDSMDYYQRKAMASAMGLNEQQLALMMRGKLDLIREPQKSAAEIQELAEQTKDFNTIMEELSQTAKMFAINFGPLVGWLKEALQIIQSMPEWVRTIGAFSIALAALGVVGFKISASLIGVASNITNMAAAAGLMPAAGKAIGAGSKPAATGIASIGVALTGSSVGLASFAGAMLSVAAVIASVGVAAAGIAYLFKTIADIFSLQMVSNIAATATAIYTIVDAISKLNRINALALGTIMVSTAAAAPAATLASATITGAKGASAAAAASPAAGAEGAPPTAAATSPSIVENHIHLKIGETEFAKIVNSVKVSSYTSGSPSSAMYDSVAKMIDQGLTTGKP